MREMRMKTGYAAGAAVLAMLFAAKADAQSGNVPVPRDRIYVGAMTPVTQIPTPLETGLGARLDIIQFNNHITDDLGGASKLASLQKLGASYPILSLALAQPHAGLHGTTTNNASGLAEKPDDYYREWAQAIRAYGKPIFLRWGVEMNQTNFPWCVGDSPKCVDPNTGERQVPADFVQAWRHIHDIFRAEGATNVSWVWCPGADPDSRTDPDYSALQSMYPGDAYVDWTCLNVYNKPLVTHEWLSFGQVLDKPMARIMSFAPNKPMMIGETNSMADPSDPGRRAQWFADAFGSEIPKHPQIRAVVIWQKDRSNDVKVNDRRRIDWMVEDDSAALSALRRALENGAYKLPALGQ
jgi:hypothetical protein